MTTLTDISPIDSQVLGIITDTAPRAHDRTTIAFEIMGREMPPTRTFHAARLVVDHCLSRLLDRGYLTADPDGRYRLADDAGRMTGNTTP